MRVVSLFTLILICSAFAGAQDGSNMIYVAPDAINKTHIGRPMHIDFYRKTEGNYLSADAAVNIDRVKIKVAGKQIEFVERRRDDRYNSWFSDQYLESVDKKVRIREFKLLSFDRKTVRVNAYLDVEPLEVELVFQKANIAQFLIKDDLQ